MGQKTISIERGCFNFEGKENFVKKINNLKAGQIKEFTLDDIEFNGTLSINSVNISKDQEFIESNFVPLDIYCGQSLYKQIREDLGFAWDVFNKAKFSKIYFVGSTLEQKNSRCQKNDSPFYLCLSYPDGRFNFPTLSVEKPGFVENSEFDSENSCLAVFKKSFIEKEEVRIKEMAKKRKVRPWPSFAECQAATIKLLRAENNKLKTRCCDLEKDYQELQGKYDKDICNVIRPQLNTETIELLCKRICDFDLSVRITRAMEATEIIYLFQLVSWKKDELEKIRNIRKVSIKNIQHFLAEHNLELGTSFFQEEYNFFWKKVEQK